MGKQEVIARIVQILDEQSKWSHYSAAFLGQSQALRKQGNEAIGRWIKQNDAEPIEGSVQLLAMMNIISLEEADTLTDAVRTKQ